MIAAWPVIDPLYRFRYAKDAGKQTLIDAHLEYWGTEEAMSEGSCVAAAEED